MTFSLEQNPVITLNSGQKIPQLGLGVYKVSQDIADTLMIQAIEAGYRRIDTAALYDNELEVGSGLRKSGIPREELFVTTKIWNDRQGYANALEAIDESLDRLKLDYIDMLLIHWPKPAQDLYVETWRAFEEVLASGRVKGIGVSNFMPAHLDNLLANSSVVPALNQVELNPGFQQPELRAYNAAHGIATEAWSPIGRNKFADNAVMLGIASKHGKSVTQVIIRWHIQLGNLVIPKTSNPDRLIENIDVFDFELSHAEMAAIAALDTGVRYGPSPDEF
jgi:2,5-diketo-D-gluconate reductase A